MPFSIALVGVARAFGRPSHLFVILIGLFLCVGARESRAADLDASQKKLLTDAQAYLKQLNSNLKLAQDAAGPGEDQPATSKARLSASRLSSAKQSQAEVKARLERLPADNADVKTLQTDYDTASAAITALENRITGKAKTGTGDKMPAAGAGKPLDYRQKEALKNAQFHINDVQGKATALAELAGKVKAAADPSSLDPNLLAQGMNTIEAAKRKQKDAEGQLANVPADGEGVGTAADALKAAAASIAESEKVIAPVHAQMAKAGDAGNYKDLEADVNRLRELAIMYGDANGKFQTRRPDVVLLITQEPATKEELNRITTKYAPLVAQQNGQGRAVEGGCKYLTQILTEFDAVAAEQKKTLPQQIDADLAQLKQLTDTAVKETRPAYFLTGNGIPTQIGYAEEKIALLNAMDADAAKAATQRLADAKAEVKKQQTALLDGIISGNQMPADNYAGQDKEDLKKRAIDAWKKLDSSAEVLAVRFPSQQWNRETMWRYQNREWYRIDR